MSAARVTVVLVVNGREVACEVPVADWIQHGMSLRKLAARPKTTKVVLHWTGGRRDAGGLYDTLLTKGLSVHFCVDVAGKVWQYCDAKQWCEHAGRLDDEVTSANIDTIGIEIVNPAGDKQLGPERPIVTERIHGVDVTHTEFLPAQVASALALAKALCDAYRLPYAVPLGLDGDVFATSMLRSRWEAFRGVVGHFHARRTKTDPGLAILRAIGCPRLSP